MRLNFRTFGRISRWVKAPQGLSLACSPKLDPVVMRVSNAQMGKEILDEQTEATGP